MTTNSSAWSRFWFTPADPVLLGLIRICCGAITTYILFAYTFMLPDFLGKDGWYDLDLRLRVVRSKPTVIGPLRAPIGMEYVPAVPGNQKEKDYFEAYKVKWGVYPPSPFPKSDDEIEYLDRFRDVYKVDLRRFGLIPPHNEEDWKLQYIADYMAHPANILRNPPPDYPTSDKEKQQIFDYMAKNGGVDPRLAVFLGQPAWSLWFHVTDPSAMQAIHYVIVFIAFLFTIGFCSRITSVLTWMTSLWYIHRNSVMLFGVDTMMIILLFYLMIGPSGAALSVDRLLARWWHRSKPSVVNRWRRLLGRPALAQDAVAPAVYSPELMPSVSANFALRLLQVHLCIVYGISGLTKLLGAPWWQGTAVWGTLGNYEFAPMNFEIFGVQVYTEFLRWLGGSQLLFEALLTGACWFTLAFEIGYPFLIWRHRTRWVFLSAAIMLHGIMIGVFMSLKTFSLMMLVMNMAFLQRHEIARFFGLFRRRLSKDLVRARHNDPEPMLVR